MKKLQDKMFLALCIPCLWTAMLIVDMMVFSQNPPTVGPSKIFEGIVFVTSFLFFQVSAVSLHRDFVHLFLPFLLQFMFWWIVAFFVLWLTSSNRTSD